MSFKNENNEKYMNACFLFKRK